MRLVNRSKLMNAAVVLAGAFFLTATMPAFGQDPAFGQNNNVPPPSFSSGSVDNLVSRIALYPDPLLAQIFAAASFPDQIQDAARWADQNGNLHGDQLAAALAQANLPFDPAVQALIPFPSVLDMMASDMNWTAALGNAVQTDRDQVMDAIQRMRHSAEQYGYLQSNQQMRVVDSGPTVEIEPVDPGLLYVPAYDPYIVFAPPRPGFFVGGAIRFGYGYPIGAFDRWGWGGGFNWRGHEVLVNHSNWNRSGYNRNVYGGNVTVNNYRQSAPVAPSRNYDRGYTNQYRSTYTAPAAPARSYDRGVTNQYRSTYTAPAAPARSYDRGFANQSRNSYTAPAAPARNYDRNAYSNPGRSFTPAPSRAPVEQGRSFAPAAHNNGGGRDNGGHAEHSGGRR